MLLIIMLMYYILLQFWLKGSDFTQILKGKSNPKAILQLCLPLLILFQERGLVK